MLIRDAVEADLPVITAIYNDVLVQTTAIYRDEPATLAERTAFWKARTEKHYPTIVACEGDRILGFASFGEFRAWPGYRYSVEHTVHVAADARGQGIGSGLLKELIPRAAAMQKHVMIGGIDAQNIASLRFHERLGFQQVAHFKEVGFKFGRFLDLLFVQLIIDGIETTADPKQE